MVLLLNSGFWPMDLHSKFRRLCSNVFHTLAPFGALDVLYSIDGERFCVTVLVSDSVDIEAVAPFCRNIVVLNSINEVPVDSKNYDIIIRHRGDVGKAEEALQMLGRIVDLIHTDKD